MRPSDTKLHHEHNEGGTAHETSVAQMTEDEHNPTDTEEEVIQAPRVCTDDPSREKIETSDDEFDLDKNVLHQQPDSRDKPHPEPNAKSRTEPYLKPPHSKKKAGSRKGKKARPKDSGDVEDPQPMQMNALQAVESQEAQEMKSDGLESIPLLALAHPETNAQPVGSISNLRSHNSENPRTLVVSFRFRDDGRSGSIEVPRHKVSPGKSDKLDFEQGRLGTEVFSSRRIVVGSQLAVRVGIRGEIVVGPAKHRSDDLNVAQHQEDSSVAKETQLPFIGLFKHLAHRGQSQHFHYDRIMNTKVHDVRLMLMPVSQLFSLQELMAEQETHHRPNTALIKFKTKVAMMSAAVEKNLRKRASSLSSFGPRAGPDVDASAADDPKEKKVWAFYPESVHVISGEMLKFTWPESFHNVKITEVVKVKEHMRNAPDLECPSADNKTRWVYENKAEGRLVHLIQGEHFGYHQFESSGSTKVEAHHIFECQVPETESLGGKYRPRVTIHLKARNDHNLIKVAIFVFCALIFFGSIVVGARYFTGMAAERLVIGSLINCDNVKSYCDQLETLKEQILHSAVLYFVCGFTLLVFWLLYVIVMMLWILPPKLSSFGRGFTFDVSQTVRAFSGFFLIIPLAFMVLFWDVVIETQASLIEFMHIIQKMVDALVDDMFTVIIAFDKMVNVLEKIRGDGADLKDIYASIDNVIKYEGMIRSYGQLGLEAFILLFTLASSLTFWAMLVVVFGFANGVSGVLFKVPAQLRQSRSKSLLALVIILFEFGINRFFLAINSEFVDFYVDDSGQIAMPDGRTESGLIDMFVACDQAEGSASLVPWEDLLSPINETIGELFTRTCLKGHCISFTPVDNYTHSQLSADIFNLRSEVKTFEYWISKPEASLSELGLDADGLTQNMLVEGVRGAADILNVCLDMVHCRQARPFIFEVAELLDRKLLPAMHAVSYTVALLALSSIAWLVVANIAIYVFERPRKYWFDHVSKRWFMFRLSFISVRNFRIKRGIESYVPDRMPHRCCDWHSRRLKLFYRDTMMNVYFLVCSGMLLVTDNSKSPNGRMVKAGSICLLLGSIFGVAGSWNKFEKWYNKVLRFLSLLLKTVTFVLFVNTSVDNVLISLDCWGKFATRGIEDSGPVPSNVVTLDCPPSKTPTSTCHATIKRGVKLAETNRLALLPSGTACEVGGVPVGISEAAALWGRNYSFTNGGSIQAGVYNMCWSREGGPYTKTAYARFGGLMYVDEPVNKFKTCSIEVVAGFVEAVLLCASLLPHLLLVLCTSMCTLSGYFYRMHVTDKMHQIVKGSNAQYSKSTGHRANPKAVDMVMKAFEKEDSNRQRFKEVLTRFWILVLAFIVAVVGLRLPMVAGWLHSPKVAESSSEIILAQTSKTATWLPSNRTCADCCNMKQSNCGKTLDKVVFATSHNGMSSQKEQWMQPNNLFTVENALQDGVRALMLDLYYRWEDNATVEDRQVPTPVHLCHGFCSIGFSLLSDTLVVIKQFLDRNPNELIVLILEQYVASSSVVDELTAAGLTSFLGYTHPSVSTPWPTLSQLLTQGHRLLVFSGRSPTYTGDPAKGVIPTANLGSTYAAMGSGVSGWHYTHSFLSGTHWTYPTVDAMQLDCGIRTGLPSGGVAAISQSVPLGSELYRLTIMNHFVSDPTPCLMCAETANSQERLYARYSLCVAAWKHQVNFVVVDFWSIGNVTATVNDLNN